MSVSCGHEGRARRVSNKLETEIGFRVPRCRVHWLTVPDRLCDALLHGSHPGCVVLISLQSLPCGTAHTMHKTTFTSPTVVRSLGGQRGSRGTAELLRAALLGRSPPRRILAQARLDACPSWERVAGVRGTLVRADASNVCIVRAHLCFMSIKAEGCRRSSSICRTMLTVLLR